MDELTYRRQAMIQPDDQNPDFLAAAKASKANRQYLDELKRMDKAIKKTMQVPIPQGLAERILLRQALLCDKQLSMASKEETLAERKKNNWKPMAIAASVAFLMGMATRWVEFPIAQPQPLLGQVAVKHVREEAPFIKDVVEQVTLRSINSKMEKYGATLTAMNDLKVTYVNHCSFYQGPALHMVVQGQAGPVTLFLVPKHVPLQADQNFADGHLKTQIISLQGANMVLVGEMKESLEPMAQKLQSHMHWSI